MGLETATYISDLVTTNPPTTDNVAQGDDHLRLLKSVLQATFPSATKALYFPNTEAKTADFTVAATDQNKVYAVDTASTTVDVTLPSLASTDDGWRANFVKTNSGGNALNIDGTINGDSGGVAILNQYDYVTVEWTGTAWVSFGYPVFDSAGAMLVASILKLTSTSHVSMAGGTTAQRPSSPAVKDFRYNTTTNLIEFYNGTDWVNPTTLPRGHIDGMTLSNGTDSTNDINIAAGKCRDSTDTVDIIIATALGKQLDANWTTGGTTGSPVGGRNSAVGLANDTWYHAYAARTAASAAGDVYFHTSRTEATVLTALQAETGGASYAYLRYLGSVRRATATNRQFKQAGDFFEWINASANDASNSSIGSSGDTSMDLVSGIPSGVPTVAVCQIRVAHASTSAQVFIHNADNSEVTPAGSAPTVTVQVRANGAEEFDERIFRFPSGNTNLAAKSNNNSTSVGIMVKGYWNTRGKDL